MSLFIYLANSYSQRFRFPRDIFARVKKIHPYHVFWDCSSQATYALLWLHLAFMAVGSKHFHRDSTQSMFECEQIKNTGRPQEQMTKYCLLRYSRWWPGDPVKCLSSSRDQRAEGSFTEPHLGVSFPLDAGICQRPSSHGRTPSKLGPHCMQLFMSYFF